VEIDLCGERIGKQDQYAAAFGGLNFIRFEPNDRVIVEPLLCPHDTLLEIESSLLAFYTGNTRKASSILIEQSRSAESDGKTQQLLFRMVELAGVLRTELNRGNVSALGEILDEGWCLKRELHPLITSPEIESWYRAAKRTGALGGKLLGAGGGGFLLFFAPQERHIEIEQALGLRRVYFSLERSASRVLLYHKPLSRNAH
jgi:D-glycero-alpha-D-manno-heptose-7-phosphate kinase